MKSKLTPPSLDPGVVAHDWAPARVQDDDVAGAVAGALRTLHTAWGGTLKAREALDADPTLPPAARDVQHAATAEKKFNLGFRAVDAARAAIERAILAEERAVLNSVRVPAQHAHLSTEVRARLVAMEEEDRNKAIMAALAAGDSTVVGAVVEAPAWLSGNREGAPDLYKMLWAKRHAPERVERVEKLEKLRARLDAAGSTSMARYSEIVGAAKGAKEARARRIEATK